ncbi:hypothetical protein [Armatimonas sp.]|uniref:hypothetical protein n=1 Tax=Armatimonas sp. TaxID=1872638 RepID=UPI00286C2406|nr:hypothetical protein [Armatimonas sp.]
MTESEQAQALKAAFPAEPVSEILKQRIANLTPLQPVVTGYKLKCRHVFAIFAVLWIGHNIPVAIKVTKQSLAPNRTHTRMYRIEPTPDGTGVQRVLFSESWGKERWLKAHFLPSDRDEETTQLFLENVHYSYKHKKNELVITHVKPFKPSVFEEYKILFIQALPILLLRTHDNRPSEFRDGKELRVARIGTRAYYSDPKSESIIQIKSLKAGETLMEMETNISIPDSIFAADFPKDAKRTENWPKGSSSPLAYPRDPWAALTEQVKQYTMGQHP